MVEDRREMVGDGDEKWPGDDTTDDTIVSFII